MTWSSSVSSLLLLSLISCIPACAAPRGLSEKTISELPNTVSLPEGDYALVESFSPGRAGIGRPDTGGSISDPDATDGRAWEIRTFQARPRSAIAVIRDQPLRPGSYVAVVRLKALESAGGNRLVTLEAYPARGNDPFATHGVTDASIERNRYYAIPWAFHFSGGSVELRVRWDGYASLRLDSVGLYRREGGEPTPPAARAQAAELSGVPRDLSYTSPALTERFPLPHSKAPAPRLLVMNIQRYPIDWQFVALSLQGLVNREQPRVFCLQTNRDPVWLKHIQDRGWIQSANTISGPKELLRRYRDLVRGVVITDPDVPATVNVATSLAGVENALIASPRIARELNLPVLHDLRGRWKTNAEAYEWLFENFWPKLSHQVISISHHSNMMPRDYLVQNKVFTFWITGPVDGVEPGANPTREARLMERLLARMPANIPCLGYPYAGENVGIQEMPGVSLLSRYGKYLIATDFNSNLSIHTGIPKREFRQTSSPVPPLNNKKVYLSFIVSDGDNLQVLTNDSFPNMWNDPRRGKIPVGWSVSAAAADMIPAVTDWYYQNASPADAFIGAVSGIGYMYPDEYAERYRAEDQRRVLDGFLAQTHAGMKRLDLDTIWIMRATRPDVLAQFAQRMPGLKAIFPDYGRQVTSYADATFPTANSTPVFRAVTNWGGESRTRRAAEAARQIRIITAGARPAFVHVFLQNWSTDLETMELVLKELGPDYVAVRPDHLGSLYSQYLSTQRLLVSLPESAGSLEGRSLTVPLTLMNLTGEPMTVSLRVLDTQPGMAVATPVSLQPGEIVRKTVSGKPQTGRLTISATEPGGVHDAATDVMVVSRREVLGAELPEGLEFAKRYEAESMSHGYGVEYRDTEASAGMAWSSGRQNRTPDGHIVYGPYQSLPAGRYVCLFRLKRVGPATGPVATVDITVHGGRDNLGGRTVMADDMPDGVYRSVAVEIDYNGGDLETRVQQAGPGELVVDTVTLYRKP